MSDQDTPRSRHESIVNLVKSIEEAENPEQFLLKLTVERVRQKDVELAEAIRYCAIPRRFDAHIIGILREAPEDRETNERLLNDLLSHSFVLARQDGSYVYHDNTRDMLLEDWQADADKRAQFNLFNQRLVAFYETQHGDAQGLEQDLEEVARVIQEANPARYTQLASIVETRVVTPLLEALYHGTLRSAQAGYDLFTDYFQEYEERARLTVCESLLNAIRDYMGRLLSDDEREPLLRWIDYWEARLMLGLRRLDESEKLLRTLLARVGDDKRLKLWALSDLGRLLQQQSHLRKAREKYENALELAKETPEDAHNLPVRYTHLASVYWALGDLDRAVSVYQEAIQAARENNLSIEAYARADLSGVLQDRGEWAEAFDVALEALHLARTQLLPDRTLHQAILERLMYLLARRAPRLLDTLFAEYSTLLAAMGEQLETLSSRLRYADFLQDSGQLERAEALITEIRRDASDYADTSFGTSLLFSEAWLRESEGRQNEAIALYTKMIERAQDGLATLWEHASALSNRGLRKADCGLWSEAEGDYQSALAKWEEIGNEKMIAFVRILQADAARRQGQLVRAQQSLDQARLSLEGTTLTYLASYRRVQGDVYRDQARWGEAYQQYQQALTIRRSLNLMQLAAEDSGELALVAGAQGHWEEATQHTAEANKLWLRLAEAARYQPSEGANLADKENQRGVQCFFATDGDHRERMVRAREFFRSASEQDPENVWYHLNLAYAHAELEEWDEATQAVNIALERGPEWLRTAVLYERWAEYSFKQGETLLKSGDYEKAAQIYAESLNRCENQVQSERLVAGWLGWGNSLLMLGRSEEAEAKYRTGLSTAANAENMIYQATFHAGLACVAALRADLPEVLEHSRHSLQLRIQAGQPDAASDLVREWSSLIGSMQQYRTLSEALRVLTDDTALDRDQRRDLVSAGLELSTLRYAQRAAEIDSADLIPVVTPIILDADNRLFPQGEETPQVIRMLETDIPSLRDRLQTDTGVTVPGVRIRGNDNFAEGAYVLMLHEVPLGGGILPLEEKFCPDAAGCQALGIEGQYAVYPKDRTEGIWLSEPAWERAERAGLPLLDQYQYMLSHLESLVRRYLATFLGFQEVQDMLAQWKWETEEEDRGALLDTALPDDMARRRLVQVLQDLVKEEVPVRNLTSILAAFSEANPECREVIEVVESVRIALRPDLPGNQGGRQFIGLSPGFEGAILRWVWERDGKKFLALPWEEAQSLRDAVWEHMAGRDVRNLALIVREPGLRPFVWRLVEREFSTLPVLAEGELAEGLASVSEQIEYVSHLSATDN